MTNTGDVYHNNMTLRYVETLSVQGNLYLASLLLVLQDLFTFHQPIASVQDTGFYFGLIINNNYHLVCINKTPKRFICVHIDL